MRTRWYSAMPVLIALVGFLATVPRAIVIAQDRDPLRPDLSGGWRLNGELSENAEAKLERMQSQSSGGPGPSRHGGLGGLFGGPQQSEMEEARSLLLNAPSWFVARQDGERIVLTDSGGHVRTLNANGRKEKIDGRDVRTKWDKQRLVSEISLGSAKVTETYERSTDSTQLIVTTKMDMHGREMSVRRVYEAEGLRWETKEAPKQLHRLRDLIQQGDAERFANELNLDSRRTREWFEQGFTREGYGADVVTELGTLVLSRIVVDSKHRWTP